MHNEHIILFAGPMGAGKTAAISALSEIPVVSTEALNNDLAASAKLTTTVALDYGQITLEEGHMLRLYGVPGQERFAFVWNLLQTRAAGLVLLLDACARDPLTDVDFFLDHFRDLLRHGAAVVGVTRTDLVPNDMFARCCARLRQRHERIPVFEVDARDRTQMVVLLATLITLVQMRATELEAN